MAHEALTLPLSPLSAERKVTSVGGDIDLHGLSWLPHPLWPYLVPVCGKAQLSGNQTGHIGVDPQKEMGP